MLNNASNNASAMEWIQDILTKRGIADMLSFHHQHNCVRCYAHIINICSSHVISSFTSMPKSYLSQLKVPLDPDYLTHCSNGLDSGNESDLDSEDESCDSDDDDIGDQDYKLKLARCHNRQGKPPEPKAWVDTMKGDPLRRARRVIRLLRSLDNHRTKFQKIIVDGNKLSLFMKKDSDGNQVKDNVPELQLLRDVKTRWDSVYMMLLCLRQLRLVSHACCLQ